MTCPPPPSSARWRTAFVLALVWGASSSAARAQPSGLRPGAGRDVVVQLAYSLGEAHALHRLCAGPSDVTWYARMQHLEAEEGGDDSGRRQLVEAFNAGFAARQSRYPACTRRSRQAERAVAANGAVLARRLAGGGDGLE